MKRHRLPLLILAFATWPLFGEPSGAGERWNSRLGRGNGVLEAQSFLVVRSASGVETRLPASGQPDSTVTVELDSGGNLVRSRTDYQSPSLADWYRADFLLTEVQRGEGPDGTDNLAFQRVWKNEVHEAKNYPWGDNFAEFSTLPFLLEKRLARGSLETWTFRTYSADIPGEMQVQIRLIDRPLDIERRYSYPRWLRERLSARRVLLAELNGVGDFKGAYPYPFYYAFTPGPRPEWIAAWGGSPQTPSFQWREE